jgi:hypothetical protein
LRWTELDQDKALAWKREQRKICPGCSTRRSEWDRDRDAYIGDIEVCPGCERVEQEQENVGQSKVKGVKIRLVPKELARTGEELGG